MGLAGKVMAAVRRAHRTREACTAAFHAMLVDCGWSSGAAAVMAHSLGDALEYGAWVCNLWYHVLRSRCG